MGAAPLPFDPIAEARRQWEAHRLGAPAAMAAATSIMRAQQLVLATVDRALEPHDLTFARFEVLMLLHFSRSGRLPMGKIGSRLMVHPASVTSSVNRLVEQGFVRRVAHAEDRRIVLAELTHPGRHALARAAAAVSATGFGLDAYDERAHDALTEALRVLRADHDDFVADPPPADDHRSAGRADPQVTGS